MFSKKFREHNIFRYGGVSLTLQVISNEIAHKMDLLHPVLLYSQLQTVRLRESAANDPSPIFWYSYEAILISIFAGSDGATHKVVWAPASQYFVIFFHTIYIHSQTTPQVHPLKQNTSDTSLLSRKSDGMVSYTLFTMYRLVSKYRHIQQYLHYL